MSLFKLPRYHDYIHDEDQRLMTTGTRLLRARTLVEVDTEGTERVSMLSTECIKVNLRTLERNCSPNSVLIPSQSLMLRQDSYDS